MIHLLTVGTFFQVEITLEGQRLLPSLQLCKVMDLWLHTKPTEKKSVSVGSSAGEFVMPLTYCRQQDFSS